MKSKAWLTIFAVISFLLIGAAGFFSYSSSKKFSTARESWDNKVGTILTLERKPLYPNEENVQILKKDVTDYQKSVDNLFLSLNQFQKPLDKALANIEFQDQVKTKVNEFRKVAAAANFEIVQDDSFQLGFDAYSNSVPVPAIVPILDYELKAIDHLLRKIISSGGESMSLFSRDLVPGEVGGPAKQDSGVVHKYPVRLAMRCSHKAFQTFMNSISNDKEFFYVVRVLNVQNEVREGPLKEAGPVSSIPRFANRDTGQPAGIEDLTKWGYPGASAADLTRAAAEDGFEPSGRDARVLMGQEKLDVFMVIDVVRFLDPSEVEYEEPVKVPDSRKNRR